MGLKQENRRSKEIVLTILTIVVFVMGIGLSSLYDAEIDISREKSHSVSPVSQDVIENISEPITITYYVSKQLKRNSPIPGRISAYIEDYASSGKGKIAGETVEVKAGDAEMLIKERGLVPHQIEPAGQDGQNGASLFSGIVIESADRMTAIPFIYGSEMLEYEITSGIKRLLAQSKNQIGILVGDKTRSIERYYSLLTRFLVSLYSVRTVENGASVPKEIETLLVLGQRDITEEGVRQIDEYLTGGGSVLLCIDPVYVDLDENLNAETVSNASLSRMLARYGVETEKSLVLDDQMKNFRIPLSVEEYATREWRDFGSYPFWISLQPENINNGHLAAVRSRGLDLLWSSPLFIQPVTGLSHEVLASTTSDAWLMNRPFITQPGQGQLYIRDREATSGRYPVAVSVEGTFDRDAETYSKMVVIGDTDFASDLMEYSESMYNLLFIEGALNRLTEEEDILSLLPQNGENNSAIRDNGTLQYNRRSTAAVLLNVVIIPLAVILAGLIRYYRRNRA